MDTKDHLKTGLFLNYFCKLYLYFYPDTLSQKQQQFQNINIHTTAVLLSSRETLSTDGIVHSADNNVVIIAQP